MAVFLQSGCTDMLFVEADVRFDPESVVRMLESDKPVIGAACLVKQLPLRHAVSFRFDDDSQEKKQVVDGGATEVDHVGASCLLILRGECVRAALPAAVRYASASPSAGSAAAGTSAPAG